MYEGARDPGGQAVVTVSQRGARAPLEPGYSVWNHSPTGFEWGYCGSGPAQLALAIVLDCTQSADVTVLTYQAFKRDVISKMSRKAGWQLSEITVLRWLVKQLGEIAAENDIVSLDAGVDDAS